MADEYEQSNIITHYNQQSIIPESYFFSVSSLLTVFFIFQKVNDNLMAKWNACFYPIYVYFIVCFLSYFYKIVKSEISEENDNSGVIKIRNFDRAVLISNFFNLVNSPIQFLTIYYFAEHLDKRDDTYLFYSMYMFMSYCVFHIIYTFLKRLDLFRLNIESQTITTNHVTFGSTFLTPLLTYVSNMMIVCNSSGVCTQVYMSTIASFLGAFGVTLSDLSEYLFPITIILLGVSLFSLYIKKRSFLHKPFLLGCAATTMIICSHIWESLYILMWIGNIIMIGAAIWNARLNKFYGLPRYSK
jgi:hypothetical protein